MGADLRLCQDIGPNLALEPATDTSAKTGCAPSGLVPDKTLARRDNPSGPYAGDDRAGLARPSGSIRSDSALALMARSALGQSALVPADKVRVVVRNGWLILEGEVEARVQRQAAEDSIKGLPEIRGVSNNILIESEIMAQRVSRKIDEAFVRNARLSASRISVTACNHNIILSGSVRTEVEREEAETAAWAVEGVAQVVNRIRATA